MSPVGTMFIEIRPETAAFISRLDRDLTRAAQSAGDKMARELSSKLSKTGSTLTKFVSLPAGLGLGLAVKEANEAQRALRQTDAVIKSTGATANVTSGHIGVLADKFGRVAAVDNDVVRMGLNWLLTFKNIKNVGADRIFDRTAKSAVDLAATLAAKTGGRTGDSIAGAATLLGKALNDPIKGLQALNRAGVTFTQSQKDQIVALTQSGKMLQAQKIILGEVESQTRGAAAAQATSVDRISTAFGDLAEKAGTAALPAIEELVPVAEELVDLFSSLPDWAQTFVVGGAAAGAAVGPLLKVAAAGVQVASGLGLIGKAAPGVEKAEGTMSRLGGKAAGLGLAAVAAVALAAGIERIVTGGPKFALTARQIAEAPMKALVPMVKINYEAGQLAEKFREVSRESPQMAQRLLDAARKAGVSGKDLQRYKEIIANVAEGQKRLSETSVDIKAPKGLQELQANFTAATDAAKTFKSTLDVLFSGTLGVEAATLKYQDSLAKVSASLLENGNSLDIYSEKGRANRDAILGATDAALGLATAMVQQSGNTQGAALVLTDYAAGIQSTLQQAGVAQPVIDQYLQTLGLTPAQIVTTLNAIDNGTPVVLGLDGKIHALDATSANPTVNVNDQASGPLIGIKGHIDALHDKTIYINTQWTGFMAPTRAHGGPWRAASGGQRMGFGIVGERGPESVFLPFGARVVTAQETARAMRGMREKHSAQKMASLGGVGGSVDATSLIEAARALIAAANAQMAVARRQTSPARIHLGRGAR